MSRKIGEAQGIDFFSTVFREKYSKIYDNESKYSVGVFSGSQDRRFADFFAGTESTCMLIEFKEFAGEVSDELGKPLREHLCLNLDDESARLSRGSHYIAYRTKTEEIRLEIAPYIDVVCPGFGVGLPPLAAFQMTEHGQFIDRFFNGGAGSNYTDFVRYAGHMSSIAGKHTDGLKTPFKAILYSRNAEGVLKGTKFKTLREFKTMVDKHPKPIPPPKRKRSI